MAHSNIIYEHTRALCSFKSGHFMTVVDTDATTRFIVYTYDYKHRRINTRDWMMHRASNHKSTAVTMASYVHGNPIDDVLHETPFWLGLWMLTLTKTTTFAMMANAAGMSVQWKVWLCFIISFWCERTPAIDIWKHSVKRAEYMASGLRHRTASLTTYRGRMLLFTVLFVGFIWAFAITGMLHSWYNVLVIFTVTSFIRYCIDIQRTGVPAHNAVAWASRITLATTAHVSFSCLCVYELASFGINQRSVIFVLLEFAFMCLLRHPLRYYISRLLVGNIYRHPSSIRRYMTLSIDLGITTGLYCTTSLPMILAMGTLMCVIDSIVRSSQMYSVRTLVSIEAVPWTHLVGLCIALPIDIHRGGVMIWYERTMMAVLIACMSLLSIYTTQYVVDLSTPVRRRRVKRQRPRFIEQRLVCVLQTASTAFAIAASLISISHTARN